MNPKLPAYYIEAHPSNQFKQFINCFKVYQFYGTEPVHLNPEGLFEIIFQLDGSFSQKGIHAQRWERRPDQFIGGLHNRSFFIKPHKNATLISVNFKPGGAKYFIPDDLHRFKNKIVSLDDIFAKASLRYIEDMDHQDTPQKNLGRVEAFLNNIFQPSCRPGRQPSYSPIDEAIERMLREKGMVNIQVVAGSVGLSPAHFRRRFNAEIGMSPKEYCKIVRINAIMQSLSQPLPFNLTQLAYQHGYFDQSHFIKDFQSVMGCPPRQMMQQMSA